MIHVAGYALALLAGVSWLGGGWGYFALYLLVLVVFVATVFHVELVGTIGCLARCDERLALLPDARLLPRRAPRRTCALVR